MTFIERNCIKTQSDDEKNQIFYSDSDPTLAEKFSREHCLMQIQALNHLFLKIICLSILSNQHISTHEFTQGRNNWTL